MSSVECIDSAIFKSILQLSHRLEEIDVKIDSLQKALAGFRGQVEDFKAEHHEDLEDLRKRLWELQFMRRGLA